MSDRFKFRVWDPISKKLSNVCQITLDSRQHGCLSEIEDMETYNLPHQPHLILEQCTGLEDKNGRLIYEGDIVKRQSKYSENEKDVVLQVEWNCKGARYITTDKKHDTWIFSMFDYEYEILGNIHENPELLEGKK